MHLTLRSWRGLLAVAAVGLGLSSQWAQAQLTFTRLGGLYPSDVSSDGAYVVGRNYPGYDLLRWSKDSGAVLLTQNAFGSGMSSNGQTILANSIQPTGGPGGRIFKLTVGGRTSELATHPAIYGYGAGLSGDGNIAVGTIGASAVRWVGTKQEFLGTISDGGRSVANAISEDGSTIVGYAETADSKVSHAFRWTEATGMVDMGSLGLITGFASEVSANGDFIAGYGISAVPGITAFIWNEADGVTKIGRGMPAAVSSDGSLVVGMFYDGHSSQEQGFIWSRGSGFRNFSSVLSDDYGFGTEFDDWYNLVPTEMSSSRRYIVGYGLTTAGVYEGWMLDRGLEPPSINPVPEPGVFGLVAASLLFGLVAVRRRRQIA